MSKLKAVKSTKFTHIVPGKKFRMISADEAATIKTQCPAAHCGISYYPNKDNIIFAHLSSKSLADIGEVINRGGWAMRKKAQQLTAGKWVYVLLRKDLSKVYGSAAVGVCFQATDTCKQRDEEQWKKPWPSEENPTK